MIIKANYFFLLSKGYWPVLLSLCLVNCFFSVGLMLSFGSLYSITNLLFFLVGTYLWWWEYSIEVNLVGMGGYNFKSLVKLGMCLFILSEVMLFFSFFWAYFHFSLRPAPEIGMEWPPYLSIMFDCFKTPLLNTFILLLSRATLTWSHLELQKGGLCSCSGFLWATVLLGWLFRALQYREYCEAYFSVRDGCFGSVFFMLTGLHGFHVVVGSLFLLFCGTKNVTLSSYRNDSVSFDLGAWYWHFVDLVWVYVFFFLYYLNF